MLSRRARALALSLLAVAGAGALTAQGLARARRDAPLDPPRAAAAVVVAAPVETEPPATATAAATAAPAELAPEPPTARVEVAAEAPESLADTLRAGDTGASIAAIEAAAERGDVGALRDLERIDPDRDPYVTSVAVRAIAHIAAAAPSVERDGAARTLGRWLGDASRKQDAASRGHASLLVDALADTGSRDAVAPLAALLDRADVPLHVRVRAVESLSALGDARGRPAVERFSAALAALEPSDDALDQELREEATRAVARALERL
ncbi:MAG: hypothetical protein R3B36_22475 [Polyangiaceae bacterium]